MHWYVGSRVVCVKYVRLIRQERGAEKKEARDTRLPEVKGLPDVSGLGVLQVWGCKLRGCRF